LKFEADIRDDTSGNSNYDYQIFCKPEANGKSFSLYYNDLARWLFITLAFTGILSTGWFGIPLAPRYLSHHEIDIIPALYTLFSALGTVWGIMAYREFTRSANLVKSARQLARKLNPMIGDYDYHFFNPENKLYESGFIHMGPVDFWDKETQVPDWLDKGKYWHILLGLQTRGKEVVIQVVRDSELPLTSGRQNISVTSRELVPRSEGTIERKLSKRYRYRVKIPQWLVMNTERTLFVDQKQRLKFEDLEFSSFISDLNKNLVLAADEIIEREKPRIRYPWRITAFGVYLNKSLPIRLIYKEIIRHLPGVKKDILDDINANLANVKDDELIDGIIELARRKGIASGRIDNITSLIDILKDAYIKQGLGEGSSEYHNFHHTLEVTYMSLHMLPKQFHRYVFTSKDFEIIIVAALLHDYDPSQRYSDAVNIDPRATSQQQQQQQPKQPLVVRTISEMRKTRIHEAYFTMNRTQFESHFQEYKSALPPRLENSKFNKQETGKDQRPIESIIIEALIWRTDFPYFKQKLAQESFIDLINQLDERGYDTNKIKLLGDILWLADLAVTYMGSDPIRAWDRVGNLYNEMYLPKVEAVLRTDAFFSDFAESDLFKELINMRHFPDIFRQRWNLIYQFFHEGNPLTQVNRTIIKATNLYFKINLEIDIRSGEILKELASKNWGEYFIGIGKDQNEVSQTKLKLADLDPQNASVFWGDAQKLLPNILDKSIDNFFLVLPEKSIIISNTETKLSIQSLLATMPAKLKRGGTLYILTDLEQNSATFKQLMEIIIQSGFERDFSNKKKVYFEADIKVPDFVEGRAPQVILFTPSV
jgi:tRNA G46 methylase TrmB